MGNGSEVFGGSQGDLNLNSIQFSDSKFGESFKGAEQNYGEGNFVDMADLQDTVRTFENTLPGEAFSLGSMAMYANSNMNTLGSPGQGGVSMHQSECWEGAEDHKDGYSPQKSNGKSNGSNNSGSRENVIHLEDGNLGETPEFNGVSWEKTENNFIDNKNNNYIGEVSMKSGTKTIALTEKEFELIE